MWIFEKINKEKNVEKSKIEDQYFFKIIIFRKNQLENNRKIAVCRNKWIVE